MTSKVPDFKALFTRDICFSQCPLFTPLLFSTVLMVTVWITDRIEFFLNYLQHKVGISGNYFFPFVSFVKYIMVTHKKIELSTVKQKIPDLQTLPTLCNYRKIRMGAVWH